VDLRFLSVLQAYKAGQYAAAQRQFQTLVQTTPVGAIRNLRYCKMGWEPPVYGAGQMDGAGRRFFPASDLTPSDILPLSFLGKACDGASAPLADQIRGRLQSFLASDAKNADVSYYLAACLWKRSSTDSKADRTSKSNLFRSAPSQQSILNYGDAYFQLGVL
jgi:hypothetical protein